MRWDRRKTWRRLLRLAAFLDDLPSQRFFYNDWVGDSWQGKPDLSCGTTACAMGWVPNIPFFQHLGIRLESRETVFSTRRKFFPVPVFNGKRMSFEELGRDIFGIDYNDFRYLFIPGAAHADHYLWPLAPPHDASPQHVAAHIRQFVQRDQEERRRS